MNKMKNPLFFTRNRKKIIELMDDDSVLVLFSGNPPHRSSDEFYPFTANKNFYFLTGIEQANVILMITRYEDEIEEKLYIERSDPKMEKWVGKKLDKEEASELSGIQTIRYLDEFYGNLHNRFARDEYQYLCLDLERLGWGQKETAVEKFSKEVTEKYPFLTVQNFFNDICELRMIKGNIEIENMKNANDLTRRGIESIMKNCKPGLKEYELEAEFNYVLNKAGVFKTAFDTIAASGVNATVLHYEANNCELIDGDLVLLDLGATCNNYCADVSRTIPVNGKFSDRQKTLYNIVLRAMNETIESVKPGITLEELNDITKMVLAEECKKIGLIQNNDEISRYYYHGVSHYLGMDSHDVGVAGIPIEEGMVITVEPGLYVAEEGIGIRIEDDILVTEDGHENLSAGIIKTVDDIENFMKK